MIDFWNSCIRRAEELAASDSASKELLVFYATLLRAQQEIYEFLRSRPGWLPSGSLPDDMRVLRPCFPILLHAVELNGPAALKLEAQHLSTTTDEVITDLLLSYWHSPSGEQFFAKAFLQPYARWLADSGGGPTDRLFDKLENRCPFCGGMPQLSCLQVNETSAESGNRDLVCGTCLSTWTFRRVVCAYCLEERPSQLSIFQTAEYDHVRVEACDTCKRYIKGIDLTRFGFAVPLVDEVASAALDIWAQEHFYTKIELNLVGL
jgi:formate dehydrogenase accessory protein FdhE